LFQALAAGLLLASAAPAGEEGEVGVQRPAGLSHVWVSTDKDSFSGYPLECEPRSPVLYLACTDGSLKVLEWSAIEEVQSLGEVEVTEIPGNALVKALEMEDRWVRDCAGNYLKDQGELAHVPVSRGLKSADPEVRWRCLRVLASSPDSTQRAAVRNCLRDSDPRVRRYAVKAFAATEPPDLVDELTGMVRHDRDPRVRHDAIEEIGKGGDPHGVDPVLEAVGTSDERGIRLAGFAALRRLTRQDFGRDHDQWRAWWENHRDEVLAEAEERAREG
jgi:hypothetical protein